MSRWLWVVIAALSLGACANIEPELPPAEEEDIDPSFFDNELQFKDNGSLQTVGDLIRARACSTAPATRLSMQIAQELACLAPNRWARIDVGNVRFGPAAYPFLSGEAAAAFIRAAQELQQPISVNSTWRSVAQQHTLDRWEGSCGIRIAATPGRSKHESGLAVDVANYSDAAVRAALKRNGFTWYCDARNRGRLSGCGDPVHFSYDSGTDLRRYSVTAFQALHNRNAQAGAQLTADGVWGGNTRRALEAAPLSGFATAANCGLDFGAGNSGGGLGADSGADPLPAPYQGPWIGSACEDATACDFNHQGEAGFCVDDHTPQTNTAGICSLNCEGICPDKAGHGATFCVAAEAMGLNRGGGACATKSSNANGHCGQIAGTAAMDVERYVGRSGAARRVATVCVPEITNNSVMPDPNAPPAWIGHLCSGDHQCGFTAEGLPGRCFLEHGPATGLGFCTVPCAGQCPDRAAEAQTFCVAATDAGGQSAGGVCVSRAEALNNQCSRPGGFVATATDRFVGNSGAAQSTRTVCLPRETVEPEPEPAPPEPVPISPEAATRACEAVITALADRAAEVCAVDRASYEQELLDIVASGSCDNIVAIRDEVILRRDCIPWIEAASCNALNTSVPAACREQLISQSP
jgi:hypothetical protein